MAADEGQMQMCTWKGAKNLILQNFYCNAEH